MKKQEQENFVPHTSVAQTRVPVFMPSKTITKGKGEAAWVYQSTEATFFVRNSQLTQQHRNLVDALLANFIERQETSGSIWCAFTLYELQQALGKDDGNTSQTRKLINDLFKAELVWKSVDENPFQGRGRIIEMHGWTDELDDARLAIQKGKTNKAKYFVRFSREYMRYVESDLCVHYKPLLTQIFQINHAPTQALVRYCLAQEFVNQSLKEICDFIGLSEPFYSAQEVSKQKNLIIDQFRGKKVKSVNEDGDTVTAFGIPEVDMLETFGIRLIFKKDNDPWPRVDYKQERVEQGMITFKKGDKFKGLPGGSRATMVRRASEEEEIMMDKALSQPKQGDMF